MKLAVLNWDKIYKLSKSPLKKIGWMNENLILMLVVKNDNIKEEIKGFSINPEYCYIQESHYVLKTNQVLLGFAESTRQAIELVRKQENIEPPNVYTLELEEEAITAEYQNYQVANRKNISDDNPISDFVKRIKYQ